MGIEVDELVVHGVDLGANDVNETGKLEEREMRITEKI